MRKISHRHIAPLLLATAMVLAVGAPALAQDRPSTDLAVSYSFLHDNDIKESFPVGWVVAATSHVNDWFGFVGEVGGNYKTLTVSGTSVDLHLSVHSFLAGPKFSGSAHSTVTPFFQVLLGSARARLAALGESESGSAFAVQPGGGVDISLSKAVAVRLQGDYRLLRDSGENFSEFRVAAGVVFGFGRR
jgi:opacity protein-like surface antigen